MDIETIILFILAALSVVAGVVGLVLPLLPGPLLIYIGLFLAAWAEDFIYVNWVTLLTLGLLMLVAHAVDFLAGVFGAKKYGAGQKALIGAIIGAFVGLFFGLIGIVNTDPASVFVINDFKPFYLECTDRIIFSAFNC